MQEKCKKIKAAQHRIHKQIHTSEEAVINQRLIHKRLDKNETTIKRRIMFACSTHKVI